jgi:S1-C subfamily serine protease
VVEVSDGVCVKDVTAGGPAGESGIKPNDRIVAIDDEEVKSPGDVSLALLDKKAGDIVVMRVERSGASGTEDLVFEMRLRQ